MVVRLESLRVTAALDADSYAEGAKKVAAANKAIADSGKTADAAQVNTQRAVVQSGRAFTRLATDLDPAYKAQLALQQGQVRIQREFERGGITADRQAYLLGQLSKRYGEAANSSASGAKAFKASYVEMEILRAGFVNTVQSLAAGMGVMRTVETQLFQTAPAFPALISMIGAARLAFIGGGIAAAAALGMMTAATAANERTLRSLEVSLGATGQAASLSRQQLEGLISAVSQLPSTDRGEAAKTVQKMLETRQISMSLYGQLIALAGDYAAVTGKAVPDAMNELATGLKRPVQFADELHDRFGILTLAQYRQIDAAVKAGKAYEAQGIMMNELQNRIGGLKDKGMTPLAASFDNLGNAWARLTHRFSEQGWISDMLKGFAMGVNGIANLVPSQQEKLNGELDKLIAEKRAIQARIDRLNLQGDSLGSAGAYIDLAAVQAKMAEVQGRRRALVMPTNDNAHQDSSLSLSEQQKGVEEVRRKAETEAQKIAEERSRARATLQQQIEDMKNERAGLDMTDRERFIFTEGLKAEKTARELGQAESVNYVGKIRAEAAALYDRKKAGEDAKKAEEKRVKDFEHAVERTTDRISDAFVSAFDGSKSAAQSFRDFYLQMLREIAAQSIIKPIIKPMVEHVFGGIGGSIFGNVLGNIFHEGGVAGGYAPTRAVSPLAFAGAPRYHNGGIAGLKPDEVPAILQRGERVIPNGASAGGVVVAPVTHITVNGGSSGKGSVDEQLARRISGEITNSVKTLVIDTLRQQARPGGMLYP